MSQDTGVECYLGQARLGLHLRLVARRVCVWRIRHRHKDTVWLYLIAEKYHVGQAKGSEA